MFNFLREISSLYRFFWKTPGDFKRIVFYAENENYYVNFEGIINELIDKHDQNFCYITSSHHDPMLRTKKINIKTFYLNKLLPFLMAFVNSKVFIMTLTDLNKFHLKRSIHPVHYAYVFHALVSTHMMYRDGAFDHYDSILCVGPHQTKEIRQYEKNNGLPAKQLVEAGYYRLERIYEAYCKYRQKENHQNNQKTVLIAPSWGNDNVLESCGNELITILLKNNYRVIIRPHPETVKRFPGLILSFETKFGNNENFTLEKSISTDDSLLRADVLICDCSGIALEYGLGTERPVIFLDVPLKIKNPKFKELKIEPLELELRPKIGTIVSSQKLEIILDVIKKFENDKEKYREDFVGLRKKSIYAFGHSSKIGAQHIIDLI